MKEWLLPILRSTAAWSHPALGVGLEGLLDCSVYGRSSSVKPEDAGHLRALLQCHKDEGYVLGGSLQARQFRVVLKAGSSGEAQLRAWFHAHLAGKCLRAGVSLPTQAALITAIVETHG